MNAIDHEGVVASLEGIVQTFDQDITPYAFDLIVHLATQFHRLYQKNVENDDDAGDDDGESELAAAGCLDAIKRILMSPIQDALFSKIEEVLIPVMNLCLSQEGADFIDEALDLLNILLFKNKTISQGLWFYYPVLCYIIIGLPEDINVDLINGLNEEQRQLMESAKSGWGPEFLSEMLGSFRNYIQKGGDVFFSTTDVLGNSFLHLLD